jgi:response regulator RpfG family c-di-GMP phosphodiesterase
MPDRQMSDRQLWVWTALLSTTLVVLDCFTPPFVNFWVLYMGLVLLSLWSTQRSFTYIVAGIATCLVLLGAVKSPLHDHSVWILISNRILAIAVLWGAAMLCQLRKQSLATENRLLFERENAEKQNAELIKTAEILQEKNEELAATKDVAVYTLAKVAESRDTDTGRHLERICAYSLILADELRKDPAFCGVIDQEFLTNLRQSSPLHDIGKVSISDSILLKPGRLTPDEFSTMKKHAAVGSDILQDVVTNRSEATFLKMATVVARYHHERYDGSGYPEGLAGKSIPLAARIVALADVYDALTSERPYKEAYSPEVTRTMIINQSGLHFDPNIVDAFLRRFDDFVAIHDRYPTAQPADTSLIESLLAEYCDAEEQQDWESSFLADFATLLKSVAASPEASRRAPEAINESAPV